MDPCRSAAAVTCSRRRPQLLAPSAASIVLQQQQQQLQPWAAAPCSEQPDEIDSKPLYDDDDREMGTASAATNRTPTYAIGTARVSTFVMLPTITHSAILYMAYGRCCCLVLLKRKNSCASGCRPSPQRTSVLGNVRWTVRRKCCRCSFLFPFKVLLTQNCLHLTHQCLNYFIVCRQTRCPIFGTLGMNGLITCYAAVFLFHVVMGTAQYVTFRAAV